MENQWRVVIVDDQTIIREGLRTLLEREDNGVTVVGEARDGCDAIQTVEQHRPDLVLLEVSIPKMDGISVILEIKRRYPEIKVLVLTADDHDECVWAAFKSGANGYCLKNADKEEFLTAVKRVLDGGHFFSQDISAQILQGYLEAKKDTTWNSLTNREKDILKMIGEGYKSTEIAEAFCISPMTVKRHRANLMSKLDLHNTASLTLFAINNGLVSRRSAKRPSLLSIGGRDQQQRRLKSQGESR